jgi:hypothetical protein
VYKILLHQINVVISPYFLLVLPCALIFKQHLNVFSKEEEDKNDRKTRAQTDMGT